jgi:hypothetical protein
VTAQERQLAKWQKKLKWQEVPLQQCVLACRLHESLPKLSVADIVKQFLRKVKHISTRAFLTSGRSSPDCHQVPCTAFRRLERATL